jgi:DNA-binding NarL/FixJ family response regulator/signal transduction histidine kinase
MSDPHGASGIRPSADNGTLSPQPAALAGAPPEEFAAAVSAIASELHLEPLLERIVEQAARLLDARGGAISLLGETLEAPRLLTATHNLPPSLRSRSIPSSHGLMGQIIATRGPVIVERYERIDIPLPDQAFREYAPWIGVPIWRNGDIIGTFGIGLGDPLRHPRVEEVRLLDTLAHHAAIAIENALLYRDTRALGMAEERNRLARELHDTIAQTLVGLRLEIQSLLASADTGQLPSDMLPATLRRLDGLSERALDEMRRAIWALHPGPLEGTSLEDALNAAARGLVEEGIQGQVDVSGTRRTLSDQLASNLFLIAQEVLANVRKHARARSVRVSLAYHDTEIELAVQDDGRGFDPDGLAAPSASSGFGLLAIRDRVGHLGGRLSVSSAVGVGTRVRVHVPYEPPLSEPLRHSTRAPRPARSLRAAAPARVVLVDDHALVREGVGHILARYPEFEVVGEASNGHEALAMIEQLRPDIVLLDIQMPELGGLEVLKQLAVQRDRYREPRVIVLTMSAHDEIVFEAIRAGARGYLLKDGHPDDLVRALRTIHAGGSLIAPVAAGKLAEHLTDAARLTAREREVLLLVERGLRNKEIAGQMHISEKTVQFHLANLFGKLGVQSRVEAIRVARERGLLMSGT